MVSMKMCTLTGWLTISLILIKLVVLVKLLSWTILVGSMAKKKWNQSQRAKNMI